MQNKANFGNDKMNTTLDMTSNYEILYRSPGPKKKANSNPIKPKTNPIQSQLKPKQTQFKPISEAKNERFCADKEPYNDINNATRGFYHPLRVPIQTQFRCGPGIPSCPAGKKAGYLGRFGR